MPIFATTILTAGFAASTVFPGSTAGLAPVSYGPISEPNAFISVAVLYPDLYSESPLDRWLEKLAMLESKGRERIKILDHNNEYSFGCLQFQKKTFEEFGLKYNLIVADDSINERMYDCGLQKKIAKRMLEDNYDNWRHWYTSVMTKKLGLPPKDGKEEIEFAELN